MCVHVASRRLTLPCSRAPGPGQRAGPRAHVVHGLTSHPGVRSVQGQLVVGVDQRQVLHAEAPQLVGQHALPLGTNSTKYQIKDKYQVNEAKQTKALNHIFLIIL